MDQRRKGTTTTAILKVLADEPQYAYRIIQLLEARSQGLFEFKEGLIYPALHKLEREGLIASEWQETDSRRRKYYRLTDDGRQRLADEERELRTFAGAILRMLDSKA